jgi:hypothetical protein
VTHIKLAWDDGIGAARFVDPASFFGEVKTPLVLGVAAAAKPKHLFFDI